MDLLTASAAVSTTRQELPSSRLMIICLQLWVYFDKLVIGFGREQAIINDKITFLVKLLNRRLQKHKQLPFPESDALGRLEELAWILINAIFRLIGQLQTVPLARGDARTIFRVQLIGDNLMTSATTADATVVYFIAANDRLHVGSERRLVKHGGSAEASTLHIFSLSLCLSKGFGNLLAVGELLQLDKGRQSAAVESVLRKDERLRLFAGQQQDGSNQTDFAEWSTWKYERVEVAVLQRYAVGLVAGGLARHREGVQLLRRGHGVGEDGRISAEQLQC
ncbi:hypothetical protein TYRP_020800 [Tyrophagus putrescentiae]|nr:hypothetical protein TYRP_020800 [Tyrophagus putrescentiae]